MTPQIRRTSISFLSLLLSSYFFANACRSSPNEMLAEGIALTPEIEGVVLSLSSPSLHPARGSHKARRLALLKEVGNRLRASSSDPAWQGLFRLAVGNYRAATEILSTEAAARGGKLLNDAAIAYLNLGRETNAPLSYLQALELVDLAIRDLGWSPELGYNRALILTKLHLSDLALDAWRRVAAAGDPYWAGLASRNLSQITDRLEAAARSRRAPLRRGSSRPQSCWRSLRLASHTSPGSRWRIVCLGDGQRSSTTRARRQ